jgi:hypothetical protein
VDALGDTIPSNRLAILDMFNTRTAKEDNDTLIRELTSNNVEIVKQKPSLNVKAIDRETKQTKPETISVELNPEQHQKLLKMVGEKYRDLASRIITDDDYTAAAPHERKQVLEEAYREAAKQARKKFYVDNRAVLDAWAMEELRANKALQDRMNGELMEGGAGQARFWQDQPIGQ